MKTEIIFLDVGGIILEIDWKKSLVAMGFHEVSHQQQVLAKVRSHQNIYDYERGKLSKDIFFKGFAELLNLEPSLELENAFNLLIAGPLPGAEKIFDAYSGKVPICALSNTNDSHHTYQSAQFPILKRFDHFLTSFELGHRKPDPEIFIAAAEKMSVRPEQAIFIDDSPANVAAAKRVGYKAFQTVNSPEQTLAILQKEVL